MVLKIHKMPPTEYSKMLRKYKFWIYYIEYTKQIKDTD